MKGRHRLKASESIHSRRLTMMSPIAAQLGRVREPRIDKLPTPVEIADGQPPWVAAEIAAIRAAERRIRRIEPREEEVSE